MTRAIFWPAFGPYVAITIRDWIEIGEVELVAEHLDSLQCRYRDLGPPKRWVESRTIDAEQLAPLRAEMAEIRPDLLPDPPDCFARDGFHLFAEVRRDEHFHEFEVHDDQEIWKNHPTHRRYFRLAWSFARHHLAEGWSGLVLDPRHFGNLLADVALAMFPPEPVRSTRRRS